MIVSRVGKKLASPLPFSNRYKFTVEGVFRIPQYNQYHVCTKTSTGNLPRKSWMKSIRDDTLVSMLSIPGTHDSGTYTCPFYKFQGINQTQSLTTFDQLQAGIRYLDLRVNKDLKIYHGPSTFQDLSQQVENIKKFLDQNKTEFVLLAFQGDNSEGIRKAFQQKVQLVFSTKIPSAGQLRGKAWAIGGLGIDFNNRTFIFKGDPGNHDQKTYYAQNSCDMSDQKGDVNMAEKWNLVNQTAFQKNVGPERMKFNFLSGSFSENHKINGFFEGYFPYKIAISESGPNALMRQKLFQKQNQKLQLGLTIMDFPGQDLIDRIIKTNGVQPL